MADYKYAVQYGDIDWCEYSDSYSNNYGWKSICKSNTFETLLCLVLQRQVNCGLGRHCYFRIVDNEEKTVLYRFVDSYND